MFPCKVIDYDTWEQDYVPIFDQWGNVRAFDWTIDADMQELDATTPDHIWTCVSVDDESVQSVISAGCHSVNRLHYYITEKAHNCDVTVVD